MQLTAVVDGLHALLSLIYTDAARLDYAALRVLRRHAQTICFVTEHGETFRPMPDHYHFSHVETLRGHDARAAGDALVAEPEQLDRFSTRAERDRL